jgi:hypothetical protein
LKLWNDSDCFSVFSNLSGIRVVMLSTPPIELPG